MESFGIEGDVVMERFQTFEDMVEVLETNVSLGDQIKLKVEQDWTTEIIAESVVSPGDGWIFKWAGLRNFPLCAKIEEEKFQLINQLKGENWIQELEDAINSGDMTEHLKRVLKLRSFE